MESLVYLCLFVAIANTIAASILLYLRFKDNKKEKEAKSAYHDMQQIALKLRSSATINAILSAGTQDKIPLKPFLEIISTSLDEIKALSDNMRKLTSVMMSIERALPELMRGTSSIASTLSEMATSRDNCFTQSVVFNEKILVEMCTISEQQRRILSEIINIFAELSHRDRVDDEELNPLYKNKKQL